MLAIVGAPILMIGVLSLIALQLTAAEDPDSLFEGESTGGADVPVKVAIASAVQVLFMADSSLAGGGQATVRRQVGSGCGQAIRCSTGQLWARLTDDQPCQKRLLFVCLLYMPALPTLNACSTRSESFRPGSTS